MLDAPTNQDLPDDVEALRRLLIESRAQTARLSATVRHHALQIEKLKLQLAKLQRMQFGRSSEKLAQQIEQLELLIEELETPTALTVRSATRSTPDVPARRALPEHLPRESVVHVPACTCPDCGGALRDLGEDVSEILDYVPSHWKVIRHVRPKRICEGCRSIHQAPAPSRPISRSHAGAGLLAHVLVSKYADHCRCTGRPKSTPARASRSSARPWPTGSAVPVPCWHRWLIASDSMCCLQRRSTPTTRRCRCSHGDGQMRHRAALDLCP